MAWTAHIDGGSRGNPGPAGAGVSIDDEKGREVFGAGFFLGHTTNNQAEYAGLLRALKVLRAAGADDIRVLTDSELLAHQINGIYRVKSAELHPLYLEARKLLKGFDRWDVRYVPRAQNRFADRLANQAIDARKTVLVRDRLDLARHAELDLPAVKAEGLFDAKPLSDHQGDSRKGQVATSRARSAVSGIEVVVARAPRKGTCRAAMKQGDRFIFTEVTPSGMCVEACAAVMEAVLAVRDAAAAGVTCDEAMSCRCPHPDCGAVFDIRQVQQVR
ncbi:MAG TPA: TIGR04076 family protein [Phycisphaerae bacterium]|nr:TIGR04076 family protein [Phycisphaerae bacterium]HRR83936.1 TIGR04076 family protein [Phycisphaerae bacterium]